MRKDKNNITLSLENIISFFRNITSHFTGKEKITTLVFTIIMLSFTNIINTSALSYQSNVGLSFTFNPTLSVNISPSNLTIDNLTPGTTSDSNTIDISVATNAAYGYTLSAIVNGNNSNLTHNNGTNVFSSIATDASLSSLTTDNTWGYSYKDNTVISPAWSNYSGLSNSAVKTLLDTDTNDTETGIDSVDFKIAARAGETQASGTYTGTINFTAVTKLKPKEISDLEYLQDFAELDEVNLASVKSSMPANSIFTLKDKRDEQEYTVAKLGDSNIWMTKSLNLAGGAEITSELSDVSENYTLSTTNGFQEGNKLPISSQSGFGDNSKAYVYNSENNTNNCSSPGCYSYYSWTAATAGSGINVTIKNTDAAYSICPKGWKLPSTYDGTNSYTDFKSLMIAYGGSDSIQIYNGNTSPTGATFYSKIGPNTVLNFLRAGYYFGGSFRWGDYYGRYWTSTVFDGSRAQLLRFDSSSVNFADNNMRCDGYPVRCVAR